MPRFAQLSSQRTGSKAVVAPLTPYLPLAPARDIHVSTLAPGRPAPTSPADESPGSGFFAATIAAYRSSGGTARGEDLVHLLEHHGWGDYMCLARRVVARDVFGFKWRGTLWIPMFQFEPTDLSVKPGQRQVLSEIGRRFDDWDLASWFAQGNAWLGGRRPADVLDTDLVAVVDAARADRFIAAG